MDVLSEIRREAKRLVLLDRQRRSLAEQQARQEAEREKRLAAVRRVRCGAKTRAGHPCKMQSEKGRRRCKFHGGKSTGPKTQEGRQRIAEAQRKRWAAYRLTRSSD